MKKTKLLALASLLLVAGLVGCGGGETGSTPAASEDTPVQSEEAPAQSEETPAQSEETPAQSEETPAQSEETPAPSEEAPAPSEEAPAQSENTPAGSYSSTAAISLEVDEVGTKYTAGLHTVGGFTMVVPDGKTNEVKSENKTVTVNGVEKTYDRRINNNAGATTYEFTAEKAGKFVFVARSSSKEATEDRLATLSTIDGVAVESITIPGGTVDAEGAAANSPYVSYEIEFAAAGDYSFQIAKYNGSGAGTHILDMLVFYAE
ncbi:MAG: hypothetical protein IJA36_08165 [Lachnospiraceae bacterium]|nr:hypothetical protein [Lachnospiraceae bacterium]